MRVAVPFGKSKIYTGLVLDLHQIPPTLYEAKEIHQILDEKPIVNEFQIQHWQWIATYYMCNLGDVFRGAMPSAFILESETKISQKKDFNVNESELSDDEFLIFEALQHQSSLKVQDIIAILNKKKIFPIVQKLLNKNVLSLQEEMQEEYKPKLIRYIRLHEDYTSDESLISLLDSLKGAKQKEVLMHYFQLNAQEKKPISVKQLTEISQSTSTTIKTLIDKTIFEEYFIQEDRVNFDKNKTDNNLVLSEAQQKAFIEIKESFLSKDVSLLHGVTSSGKTEIYTKLIEEYIAQGKQVLY
jgi:primosomal protein N' (replication factor Y)